MNVKLTLNIDKTLSEEAKKIARQEGRSLSDLVENYFRLLITEKKITISEPSKKLRSLRGVIGTLGDNDYKSMLAAQLTKKHGA